NDLLKAAMSFLEEEHYPSVNIITKEFKSQHYSAFVNQLDVVVFAGNQKIFPVKSGFAKWKPAGEQVFVLSDEVMLRSCDGLTVQSENQYITVKDGFYRLIFDNDFIFIAEEL